MSDVLSKAFFGRKMRLQYAIWLIRSFSSLIKSMILSKGNSIWNISEIIMRRFMDNIMLHDKRFNKMADLCRSSTRHNPHLQGGAPLDPASKAKIQLVKIDTDPANGHPNNSPPVRNRRSAKRGERVTLCPKCKGKPVEKGKAQSTKRGIRKPKGRKRIATNAAFASLFHWQLLPCVARRRGAWLLPLAAPVGAALLFPEGVNAHRHDV